MFRNIFSSPQGRRIALAPGAVFSYTACAGERLRCEGGRALLSQYNVQEDFDLARGKEVAIRTHGLVVIEAIEASVLTLGSVAGQEYLQKAIQVALPAQRWLDVVWRHFKQRFTLSR